MTSSTKVVISLEEIDKMIDADYKKADEMQRNGNFDKNLFERIHGGINRLEHLRHYFLKED